MMRCEPTILLSTIRRINRSYSLPLEITREHLESLVPFFKGKGGVSGSINRVPCTSLSQLIQDHFTEHSAPDHANKASLANALALLGEKPAYIVETGSAAWGAKALYYLTPTSIVSAGN